MPAKPGIAKDLIEDDDMGRNSELLPYCLHFSLVMSFTKIIKDVDG